MSVYGHVGVGRAHNPRQLSAGRPVRRATPGMLPTYKASPRFEGVLTHVLHGPVVASHGAQDLVNMHPR